jgi:hypothetical protein
MMQAMKEKPFGFAESSHPRDRIANFDVLHYDLNLGVETAQGVIGGVATVTFTAKVDGLSHLVLDATELQIDDVRNGAGQALRFAYSSPLLDVILATPLAKGEQGIVAIRYIAARSQNFFVAGPDATNPEHMLPMSEGIVNGETLRGPRSASTLSCDSYVYMPPIPDPTITPTRSPSSFVMSRPESVTACFAATKPKWV